MADDHSNDSKDDKTKDSSNDSNNGKDGEKSGSSSDKDGEAKVPATWDDVFKHPRFQQLTKAASDAKAALDAREAKDKKAEEDAKLASGKHEEVINELRPKAERATTLEASIKKIVDEELKSIPDDKKTLVPNLPPEQLLEWIASNRTLLTGKEKPRNVNRPANPPEGSEESEDQTVYTLAQIQDIKFFNDNKDKILKAQREGRVRG